MEEEAHVALVQHIVYHLLVHLCAQGGGAQRLGFTTGKDGRTVRSGQGVNLAPDGTDVCGLAAVQTNAFVQDATAHGVLFHIVVVAVDQAVLLFQLFGGEVGMCFGITNLEVFANLLERFGTGVLFQSLLGYIVSCLVAFVVGLLAQFLIVYLMAVFALYVLAQFLGKFLLQTAHGLDGFVGNLEGFQQILLAHFLHFAFHHHDVLFGGAHHQVHIGFFKLFEGGVDYVLTVNTSHTNL